SSNMSQVPASNGKSNPSSVPAATEQQSTSTNASVSASNVSHQDVGSVLRGESTPPSTVDTAQHGGGDPVIKAQEPGSGAMSSKAPEPGGSNHLASGHDQGANDVEGLGQVVRRPIEVDGQRSARDLALNDGSTKQSLTEVSSNSDNGGSSNMSQV